MGSLSTSAATAAALIGGLTLWALKKQKDRYAGLPPAPKRLPLIGNVLDIPGESAWVKYHEWADRLDSDIISFDALGTLIIVLDSHEAVAEILERKSQTSSDRPYLPMICDLMGWEFNIGLMRYGERWRAHRRLFHNSFQASAVHSFHAQEEKASKKLLHRLLRKPDDFTAHFRHFAGLVVLSVAYGLEPSDENDPYIKVSEEAIEYLVKAALPGAFLVDIIPAMRYIPEWFPFAHFKTFAKKSRSYIDLMRKVPYEIAKTKAAPSFVTSQLESMRAVKAEDVSAVEEVIMNTASAMFVGGFDTIIAALSGFLFAMMTHPEVLKRAQTEIDAAIPAGTLPSFKDRDSLPYITAIVKEVLRWKPITPIAAAHVLETDEEYRGYRLPAGSFVIGNAWALLHNPAIYPEPERFKPERYLGENQCPDSTFAFGFGRRICPGRFMAIDSLWIAIASILTLYDITKPLDEAGNVIEPVYEPAASSLVFMPLPFKCTIKPRHAGVEELVSLAAED